MGGFWALLLVVGVPLVAGVLSYGVQRRVALAVRKQHHETGTALFLQLGVVYAVLLAFVFSDTWSQYTVADQSINAECAGLHASAMLAADLPNGAGRPFEVAVAAYLRAVVVHEWPRMRRHQESPIARAALMTMFDQATRLGDGGGSRAGAIRDQVLGQLAVAHVQRETRLFQMDSGIPAPLWAMLIGFSVVLVGFVLFSAVENPSSVMGFSALFSGWIIAVLVMIRMLDYPFQGALALSSRDFASTLGKVVTLIGP